MAVRTREELMAQLSTVLGENDSDDALSLIEDVRDTLGENSNVERIHELEQQVEDVEKNWRKKYRDTFFSGTPDPEEDPEEEKRPRTFDELFKTE